MSQMQSRGKAIATGVFFIVAAVAAIIGLALYDPILNEPGYVLSSGADTQVLMGAMFEIITAVAVIGTSVALYPVIRRHSEGLAIGYLAGRTAEATLIVVGLISLISVVTLAQESPAGPASLLPISEALVAVHDWTFLLGPGFAIGLNTLMLAYVMYRSRLVPRAIALIGLAAGPLIFVSSTAILFGAYEQVSGLAMVAAFPVFLWEMSLAVWLVAKGFNASQAADSSEGTAVLTPVAV